MGVHGDQSCLWFETGGYDEDSIARWTHDPEWTSRRIGRRVDSDDRRRGHTILPHMNGILRWKTARYNKSGETGGETKNSIPKGIHWYFSLVWVRDAYYSASRDCQYVLKFIGIFRYLDFFVWCGMGESVTGLHLLIRPATPPHSPSLIPAFDSSHKIKMNRQKTSLF